MKKSDLDIDGGRAWLVLSAVYLGIVIISTSIYMSGVLYVALLEHFQADEARTSLVGALNSGLLCLLGNYFFLHSSERSLSLPCILSSNVYYRNKNISKYIQEMSRP